MKTAFECILERCRLSIRLKYLGGTRFRAEPLFDAEVALIRRLSFEETLAQIVEYGDQLRQLKVAFHVIGGGGSSIILYLLGMSEVDPVRHDTHFQRLWLTAGGEPPVLQIVANSADESGFDDVSRPPSVSAHLMTKLESIPSRLAQQIGTIRTTKLDQATLAALHVGDTNDVFQLNSDRAKWLLSQIRPVSIEELACVTALEQISHGHTKVVIDYLEQYRGLLVTKQVMCRRPSSKSQWRLPILFQEIIMSLLRRQMKLPWCDTYPFVQAGANGRMNDQHALWKAASKAMEENNTENGTGRLQRLVESSGWAVCRAHHVANAHTSYKAAYCRTHHRVDFEKVRTQIAASAEQGA